MGVDLNAKDNDGDTPLHTAAKEDNKEIAELLIKSRADVGAKTEYGNTSLHSAVIEGNEEIAELLIKAGADVEAKEKNGRTPLDLAAMWGRTEVAELLIENCDDLNAKDKYDYTPLHFAAEINNLDFCNLIKDIVLGKNEGYNIKNKVNRINRIYFLKHFLEQKDIISNKMYDKNLIIKISEYSNLNVNLSIKNRYDKNPLGIAREKGHVAIIEVLEELENVIKNDQLIPFTDYIASK